jgi:hypothetical protein
MPNRQLLHHSCRFGKQVHWPLCFGEDSCVIKPEPFSNIFRLGDTETSGVKENKDRDLRLIGDFSPAMDQEAFA